MEKLFEEFVSKIAQAVTVEMKKLIAENSEDPCSCGGECAKLKTAEKANEPADEPTQEENNEPTQEENNEPTQEENDGSKITLAQMQNAAKTVASKLGNPRPVQKAIAKFAPGAKGALADVPPSKYAALLDALDGLTEEG